RRPHLAYTVGDVAKAVLEPAEDAEIHAFFNLASEHVAERTIHRRARGLRACEQEGQVDDAKLRHPIGQIARRLIAEPQQTVLHQPQNILGAIPEIHAVPDRADLAALADVGGEPVADALAGA